VQGDEAQGLTLGRIPKRDRKKREREIEKEEKGFARKKQREGGECPE
jgi:hypothetical protein